MLLWILIFIMIHFQVLIYDLIVFSCLSVANIGTPVSAATCLANRWCRLNLQLCLILAHFDQILFWWLIILLHVSTPPKWPNYSDMFCANFFCTACVCVLEWFGYVLFSLVLISLAKDFSFNTVFFSLLKHLFVLMVELSNVHLFVSVSVFI